MSKPKAPKTLSKEAKKWWRFIQHEYAIVDKAGLLLLQTSMEAFDRMRQCQETISAEGQTVADRFGQMKAHPLLSVERDGRSQMLAALKALNLDLEPLKNIGRPGGR